MSLQLNGMKYKRMVQELEAPVEFDLDKIKLNLAESSVSDMKLGEIIDVNELKDMDLRYTNHRGHLGLRKLICKYSGKNGKGGEELFSPDQVMIFTGSASALYMAHTALVGKGDEIIIMRPNYSSNIYTPMAIEAKISYFDLTFDNGFQIDMDKLRKLIDENKNLKLLSLTSPNNPTGVSMKEKDIDELVKLAEERNFFIIMDETYRELNFETEIPASSACKSDKVISFSSLSKSLGIPGLRTGWLITKNKELYELFLAAKEIILICGSHLDEELSYRAYLKRDELLKKSKVLVMEKKNILRKFMKDNSDVLDYCDPDAGVVCVPRVKKTIQKDGQTLSVDPKQFLKILQEEKGVYVGAGHWFFGFDDCDYLFRLGFGHGTAKEFSSGLNEIRDSILEAAK